MNVDIHIHIFPYSPCSQMSLETYRMILREKEIKVACVTDHHDTKGASKLKGFNEVSVIMGMEVTTGFGDFLVYSSNKEYLKKFVLVEGGDAPLIYVPFKVSEFENRDDTAVVWAHPHPERLTVEEIALVMSKIDAIEIFNGGYMPLIMYGDLGRDYFERLQSFGERFNKALTGGSDEDDVKDTETFVKAIKSGKIKPSCVEELNVFKLQF